MSICTVKVVEFYGGPIDGCADWFAVPFQPFILVQSATAPCHKVWMAKLLEFFRLPTPDLSTPIYFYRLREREFKIGYEFVGFGTSPSRQASARHASVEGDTIQLK